MIRPIALLAFLLALAGCATGDLVPVGGTTARVGPPTGGGGNGALQLHIFRELDECSATVSPQDLPLCLPFVDRASGQVRVAFQMQVDGHEWRVPLIEDSIEIFHKNQRVLREGLKDFKIFPHDPKPGEQLFILLIDSSGSMSIHDDPDGPSRMDKVRAALLRADVVDAFFPQGVETAVAPLVFEGAGVITPLGGKWIVNNRKDYREVIQNELKIGKGYTYLYQSIDQAVSSLLKQPAIDDAIQHHKETPTVIALTDGFNNEAPEDVCGSNAPRLQTLLQHLDAVRHGGADVRYVPTVYTVGLGRTVFHDFQVPDQLTVSPAELCKTRQDEVINGGIENRGVDNAALAWIAKVGGGSSVVSQTTDALAEAFRRAAAVRYRWFEARYKVDPFLLRRSFQTKLRLTSLLRSEASIWFSPSGWYDGPPGIPDADGWTTAAPYGRTATVVLPVLGLLAALGYVPAAWFNVRRALFSRVARKRKTR